jgi:hypothetical protein
MADDDLDEDFDPDAEDEVDEEAIVEDIDAEDEVLVEDDALADDDAVVVVAVEEEEEEVVEPAARAKKRAAEEDDDEEELDPDDVEADLDTILKDRIAAVEEEEDEDELEVAPRAAADAPDGVIPKKANEFVCTGCFLLVNRGQFGPENDMQCPVGESECPAIDVLQGAGPKAAPAKAARKR